jgi:hypothetical protein
MSTQGMTFRKGEALGKLDKLGIDEFCDRIASGDSYTEIGRELEISTATISNWLAIDPERAARAREANIESARISEEQAFQILSDPKMPVDRARELASHLRWRARVRNPRQYGDKLEIDQTTKVTNVSDSDLDAQMQAINKKLAELDAAAKAPLAAPGGGDA